MIDLVRADAVGKDLPLGLQSIERIQEHLGVLVPPQMALVDVDVVGPEPAKARLAALDDHGRLRVGIWAIGS
jgi:hypothetical protein